MTTTSTEHGSGLETPIQFCPGVGPKRAEQFSRLGIHTAGDLLWHLPRHYEDFEHVTPVAHLRVGMQTTVAGEITHADHRRVRGRVRSIITATLSDSTGSIQAVWFNQAYLADKLRPGETVRLHGRVDEKRNRLQISSPKIIWLDRESTNTVGINPVYSLVEGLRQGGMRTVIRKTFDRFHNDIREILPSALIESNHFPTREHAFRVLHCPQPGEGAPLGEDPLQEQFFDLNAEPDETGTPQPPSEETSLWERARQRLVFEEFLLHQLLLGHNRETIRSMEGISHVKPDPSPWTKGAEDTNSESGWPARFISSLPFDLTEGQRQVCHELEQDMTSPTPMNRLLQGDVGSGKTVVSVYAMVVAAAGGYQSVLMAPTELLARQHAHNMQQWLSGIPSIQVVVLTGSTAGQERRLILDAIKTGGATMIVGTHALFQEGVTFNRLGLVVVDEQHKFGVSQRDRLMQKGACPDLLVATATPIPRTLSLTRFGDMDVSAIRTLPPGRPPLITRWTQWENEPRVWEFVDQKLGEGQQAYVVCPLIQASDQIPGLPSAEEVFARIRQEYLPNRRVALLHGRFSPEEKDTLMQNMRDGTIDLVVATTVVEVGVDLPNATIMVILGANRFGLAQLHQLRGRVGRGTLKSYCILITEHNISPYAEQRMRAMEATRDGFELAEKDLLLRGPGEVFGARQSGHTHFRLADPIRDGEVLQSAHVHARQLLETDPQLTRKEHASLRAEVSRAQQSLEFQRPS